MKKQDIRSTAAVWKQLTSTGVDVTLPSGLTARVRRFQIQDYLKRGIIPATLQQIALKLYQSGEINFEDATAGVEFIDFVILQCLVSPAVKATPAEATGVNDVYLHDIPTVDRLAIFTAAFKPINETVEELRPFSKATPAASA